MIPLQFFVIIEFYALPNLRITRPSKQILETSKSLSRRDYEESGIEILQLKELVERILNVRCMLDLKERMWHFTIVEPDCVHRLRLAHQTAIREFIYFWQCREISKLPMLVLPIPILRREIYPPYPMQQNLLRILFRFP